MEDRKDSNQNGWRAVKREKRFDVKKSWPVIAVPIAALLIAALGVGAFMMGQSGGAAGAADAADPAGPGGTANGSGPDQTVQVGSRPALGADGRIGYATTGVVATEPETLQDQVDAMLEKAKEPGIALEYKNMMVSDDGVNFACYLGNSEDNPYDMFFTIYADPELTEELYLSELIRPGTRFEQVIFQKKLDPGKYTGYLVHTQIKDEEQQGEGTWIQVIQGQIATTIEIVVNG